MNITAPKQATAYARQEFNTPTGLDGSKYKRARSEQEAGLPLDLLAPAN
ncbi:hypothetical protein [Gellertiella hungarica]|uniref:Uncharacterized protein n=1 Tax=Gellertiella hungarica TaxID=1572859 RepID=A0A7W6J9Z3_9HYPH|nr:hypothetical protein [Gellertiella hungarica]